MLHPRGGHGERRKDYFKGIQPLSPPLRRWRGIYTWFQKGASYISVVTEHLTDVGMIQPISMHAEMHAILNCTGMTPSFKTQFKGLECRVLRTESERRKQHPQQRKQYSLQPLAIFSIRPADADMQEISAVENHAFEGFADGPSQRPRSYILPGV